MAGQFKAGDFRGNQANESNDREQPEGHASPDEQATLKKMKPARPDPRLPELAGGSVSEVISVRLFDPVVYNLYFSLDEMR